MRGFRILFVVQFCRVSCFGKFVEKQKILKYDVNMAHMWIFISFAGAFPSWCNSYPVLFLSHTINFLQRRLTCAFTSQVQLFPWFSRHPVVLKDKALWFSGKRQPSFSHWKESSFQDPVPYPMFNPCSLLPLPSAWFKKKMSYPSSAWRQLRAHGLKSECQFCWGSQDSWLIKGLKGLSWKSWCWLLFCHLHALQLEY